MTIVSKRVLYLFMAWTTSKDVDALYSINDIMRK